MSQMISTSSNKMITKGKVGKIRLIAAEPKYIDLASAVYACDTTGSITLLNGVATGTDNTNRIGRQSRLSSVHVHGFFEPQGFPITTNHNRVLLVLDRQPNGALPVIADVLTASTSVSGYLVNNEKRFSVLADRSFTNGPISTTATSSFAGSPTTTTFDITLPLQTLVEYNGTGATVASISTNSLFMLTIGSTAAGTAMNLRAFTRVRFTDL